MNVLEIMKSQTSKLEKWKKTCHKCHKEALNLQLEMLSHDTNFIFHYVHYNKKKIKPAKRLKLSKDLKLR